MAAATPMPAKMTYAKYSAAYWDRVRRRYRRRQISDNTDFWLMVLGALIFGVLAVINFYIG